jgi:predicted ABC-type ATPase
VPNGTKPKSAPTIYIIGGCNGAGKTTFARDFLSPEIRLMNADEIARGLSPFNPSLVGTRAGRLLLEEVHRALRRRETFALESTLSGRTYIHLLERARTSGYEVELHYLLLATEQLALNRVAYRARVMGGHSVPKEDVIRRFRRSRENVREHYLPRADRWSIWDNTCYPAALLASSREHTIVEAVEVLTR